MLLPIDIFCIYIDANKVINMITKAVNILPHSGRNASTLSRSTFVIVLIHLIDIFLISDCFVMICSLITSTIRSLKVSLFLTSSSFSLFIYVLIHTTVVIVCMISGIAVLQNTDQLFLPFF